MALLLGAASASPWLLAAPGAAAVPESAPGARPHIVVFVADDMGNGVPGSRGSGIRTPHLDALFRDGLELRRFYVAPLCTPTRAALLTGRSPLRLGLLYAALRGWSSEGLAAEEVTLAERLQGAGYQTALVGKWHLGHARRDQHPNVQGFEHFYGHLIGAGTTATTAAWTSSATAVRCASRATRPSCWGARWCASSRSGTPPGRSSCWAPSTRPTGPWRPRPS